MCFQTWPSVLVFPRSQTLEVFEIDPCRLPSRRLDLARSGGNPVCYLQFVSNSILPGTVEQAHLVTEYLTAANMDPLTWAFLDLQLCSCVISNHGLIRRIQDPTRRLPYACETARAI